MPITLDQVLKKLHAQAFDLADWTEPAIRRYHAVAAGLEGTLSVLIRKLCDWLLTPFSLWPFNLHEVFEACLSTLEKRKKLTPQQQLIIELLPEPLLLKLAVNLTPFGTMIHIPAYWSFDTKRDIQWTAIAKLHRIRVHGRQGSALAEGVAQRRQNAVKLRQLDQEVRRLGLKGEKRHEFICKGLGWVAGTDPKRIARLRAEFKEKPE